jgi:hypothetical protein
MVGGAFPRTAMETAMNQEAELPRWRVSITTIDGTSMPWRKNGKVHTLSHLLGPTWIANFKPAIFQALADGSLVARGSVPGAVDIASVALAPDHD